MSIHENLISRNLCSSVQFEKLHKTIIVLYVVFPQSTLNSPFIPIIHILELLWKNPYKCYYIIFDIKLREVLWIEVHLKNPLIQFLYYCLLVKKLHKSVILSDETKTRVMERDLDSEKN